MASAISGFITQIMNAVYGEQVRSAIVSAIEQCYSDVNNPSLQTEAFSDAVEAAYEDGFLDIQEKTTIAGMTNEKIIYRYTGTESGYIHNALYYYNGSAWVPIGSGIQTVATAALMTNQDAIYKYTGTESGYIQNALYYYNGTAFVPVSPTTENKIKLIEGGLGDLYQIPADWVIGSLASNGSIQSATYGIVTKDIIETDKPLTFVFHPLCQVRVGYYPVGSSYNATSLMVGNGYTIPKGSRFRVELRFYDNSTVTSENMEELISHVEVKSFWFDFFEKIKYPLFSMLSRAAYVDSDVASTMEDLVEISQGEHSLPTGYTRYDYIEKPAYASSGSNGYIDIGFPTERINMKDLDVSIDFQASDAITADACPVNFGIAGQNNNAAFIGIFCVRNASTNIGIQYLYGNTVSANVIDATDRMKIIFSNGDVFLNDKDNLLFTSVGTAKTTLNPILLFTRCLSSTNGQTLTTINNPFLGKVYGFQIGVGGAKYVDLVPCTDPSGAKGMYDLARGRFYPAYMQDLFSVGNEQ